MYVTYICHWKLSIQSPQVYLVPRREVAHALQVFCQKQKRYPSTQGLLEDACHQQLPPLGVPVILCGARSNW